MGVYYSSAAWGDYNKDGFIDLLINGYTGSAILSKIYTNSATGFTELTTSINGVYNGTADWLDYDNDGDLDILITGTSGSAAIAKIYENVNGTFTDDQTASSNLTGVSESSVSWGDYDNDGDSDILLSGNTGASFVTKLYKNTSGSFTNSGVSFTGVRNGSSQWGDYDNDGDLDIIITGDDGSSKTAKIYQNVSGSFSDINASITGVHNSSSRWGDFDNDGDFDLIITGSTGSESVTKRYKNTSGVLAEVSDSFEAISLGDVWPVDYDADGDLDIFLTGSASSGTLTKAYKNFLSTVNTVPAIPSGLTQTVASDSVALKWNRTTDSQTSQSGLTYNIRVGTESDKSNVLVSHSDTSGFRRIVGLGNAFQDTTFTLLNLKDGTYYWNVQAVDNNYAGSRFSSSDNSFTISYPPDAPSSLVAYPGDTKVVLRWAKNSAPDLSKYNIYRGLTSPASVLVGTVSGGTSADTSYTDSDLSNNLTYYYRVAAVDSSGNTSGYSNEVSAQPLGPTLAVTPDTLDFEYTTTQMDFYIQNSGYGDISWTLTEDISWLEVSSTSGSITQTFNTLQEEKNSQTKGVITVNGIENENEKEYDNEYEELTDRLGQKLEYLYHEPKDGDLDGKPVLDLIEDFNDLGGQNNGNSFTDSMDFFGTKVTNQYSNSILYKSSLLTTSNSWNTDTVQVTISRAGLTAGINWGIMLVTTGVGQQDWIRVKMTVQNVDSPIF